MTTTNRKPTINSILKSFGFKTVTMCVNKGNGHFSYVAKPHTQLDGRKIGLVGGHIGPLTVTNAHRERNTDVMHDLVFKFKNAGYDGFVSIDRQSVEVKFSGKVYKFVWTLLPTYAPSVNLDRGYYTYWLMPVHSAHSL